MMTRDEALTELRSPNRLNRFRAALALARTALPTDVPLLLAARTLEDDAYVLAKLSRALETAQATSSGLPNRPREVALEQKDDHLAHAIREVEEMTGTLLHEIGSKIGLVAFACSQEIPDYENSITRARVRNLQSVFDAIGELRSATNRTTFETFELAEALIGCITTESSDRSEKVALQGRRPFLVFGNENLVKLAFSNGIRNAFEAVEKIAVTDSPECSIVVTWGETDKDYWISIIDSGPGLLNVSREVIFRVGGTTKPDHIGYGMAIAQQAMTSLEGTLDLTNSPSGGARFEMRWSKK